MIEKNSKKVKSPYTHGVTRKRVTKGGIYLHGFSAWATEFRRNATAVASPWRRRVRFDKPVIEL